MPRAPQSIEHLSNNGSAQTVRETKLFAPFVNLMPYFTPLASPQSNGMSEAFIKILVWEFSCISPFPNAVTALR